MLTQYITAAEGYVRIYRVKKSVYEPLWDNHNDITSNALRIVSRALAGNVNFKVDNIAAYRSNQFVSGAPISGYQFPTSDTVVFTAIFDESSFNGTVDELRLVSGFGGTFSIIDNLSIIKDNTSRIAIEWSIKFRLSDTPCEDLDCPDCDDSTPAPFKMVKINTNYTATPTDDVILVDSSLGPITVVIPNYANDRVVEVVDFGMNAGTNNISIIQLSGNTLNFQASYIINNDGGYARIFCSATLTNDFVMGPISGAPVVGLENLMVTGLFTGGTDISPGILEVPSYPGAYTYNPTTRELIVTATGLPIGQLTIMVDDSAFGAGNYIGSIGASVPRNCKSIRILYSGTQDAILVDTSEIISSEDTMKLVRATRLTMYGTSNNGRNPFVEFEYDETSQTYNQVNSANY
jgi:hypothetical protein